MSTVDTARLQQAITAHRAGDLERAIAGYRQILTQTPDTVAALANLGSILRQKGNLEEAITLLQRAVALPDANEHASYNLGNALRVAGRHEDAVEAFQQTIKRKPDWALGRVINQIAPET